MMEESQVASRGRLRLMKERTEEDGVRGEDRMGGGIKEIFSLIRVLQDTNRQGTVSDGGWR